MVIYVKRDTQHFISQLKLQGDEVLDVQAVMNQGGGVTVAGPLACCCPCSKYNDVVRKTPTLLQLSVFSWRTQKLQFIERIRIEGKMTVEDSGCT